MKCKICGLEHEKTGLEYCLAAALYEISRLKNKQNMKMKHTLQSPDTGRDVE